MKRCFGLVAATMAVCFLPAGRAPAQAGGGGGRSARLQIQANERNPAQQSNVYGTVVIYPVAIFQTSGVFADRTSGTRTARGRLTAVDIGYLTPRQLPIEIGGWFWGRSESGFNIFDARDYVYQFHARTFFTKTRELGVQVATLRGGLYGAGGRGNKATSSTFFLLTELSSDRMARSRFPWVIQLGLGIYNNPEFDPNRNNFTKGFTGFVQGSFSLSRQLSLNLSEWYLRDRDTDYNRFLLGLGYDF